MKRIFIDGSAGTTGLRIADRLRQRADLTVTELTGDARKELAARIQAANEAELVFLCLPDAAAREIVPHISPNVRVCDTSTAHRTHADWTYGFPEIAQRRAQIASAARVAVPGCHASGFIALVAPLVERGIVPKDMCLSAFSLTGYTGGGKSMIAAYEAPERPLAYDAPRAYGLALTHKHLPEMQAVTGLATPPLFMPVVADFPRGMAVSVPLFAQSLAHGADARQVAQTLADYYAGEEGITVHPLGQPPEDGFLPANCAAGSDRMEIYVFTNGEQILLTSVFDNLGKGSSGAAIQCMNIMLGCPEREGLEN